MIWYIIPAFIVGVITGIVLMALCAINKREVENMSDGSKADDACCENCFFAQGTDVDGLIYCERDERSKDCDMVCKHWARQD